MSGAPLNQVLPAGNVVIVRDLKYFVVENVRSARRFLKRCDPSIDISTITFFELNRHTDLQDVDKFLDPLRAGESMGVMSDAGCPAVADPGAIVVAVAQKEGMTVRPLVGPSSILMGIMASGFNGQGFSFHGYLPIEDAKKADTLKRLESESRRLSMTQIFIETPYRNEKLLAFMAKHLQDATRICVACDLTDADHEMVATRSVAQWKALIAKGSRETKIAKRPAVFLIYAGEEWSVQQTKKSKK